MFEIFLLSMITGGLAKMVEKEGGLEMASSENQQSYQEPSDCRARYRCHDFSD